MNRVMTNKEMRSKIYNLMLKHSTDMVLLPAVDALALGIEYVTFKGLRDIQGIDFEENFVPIKTDKIKRVYKAVRVELEEVHLYELTRKEVEYLSKHIVFGSYFLSDYINCYGVAPQEVASYAEGYIEVEDEYESFYDYIQSIEYCE